MHGISRLIAVATMTIAAAVAGTAQAQNLSSVSSTGSVNVTVEIPPVAAALAANSLGAAGLWTIEDAHGGLMVSLPSDVSGPSAHQASIFNGVDTVFSAAMEDDRFVQLTAGKSGNFNGLRRQDLALQRTGAAAGETPAAVTMLITGM